ncbi:MAG: hypothetical protein LBK95_17430 [Bifidobacteriaceae bacterium]|nr:hypothetical protein [Bifidobacteriaceae bacterium]
MKRRDLMRRINQIAKAQGQVPIWAEGASHTKLTIGSKSTVIPRHREIKEPLAKKILADIEED